MKSHLTNHVKTHTKEKPFKCGKCDYAAAVGSSLSHHESNRHNTNKTRNFPSPFCSKLFFLRNTLYNHIHTHTKEKLSNVPCEFCKKLFCRDSVGIKHQIICKLNPKQNDAEWVSKQKRNKCDLCEYSSVLSSNLKRHMIRHTGEKPFPCTFCGFRTTVKTALHTHLRTHTHEKPNKCLHCDFTANRKSQVTEHSKRRHSSKS